MYSYVLLFLCLYLLQHPACFLIRSLALARDDVVVDACDVLWVFTFNFRHKNIRTKGYIECSNVENAYKLNRPLMIVVGELDDNVDPSSTIQVVNALQKAGKDFELVYLPGERHTMGGSYGEHKRYDFFVKNLLKVTPPSWEELKKMK